VKCKVLKPVDGRDFSREGEISRLYEVYAEAEHRILLINKEYAKQVVAEFSDQYAQQIRLQAEHMSVEDKLTRIELKAPVDGKIKGMEVATNGEILKPFNDMLARAFNEA